MPLPFLEIVLVFTAVVVFLGFRVLRCARAAEPEPRPAAGVCRRCTHRNPEHATFCAKCGGRLPAAAPGGK